MASLNGAVEADGAAEVQLDANASWEALCAAYSSTAAKILRLVKRFNRAVEYALNRQGVRGSAKKICAEVDNILVPPDAYSPRYNASNTHLYWEIIGLRRQVFHLHNCILLKQQKEGGPSDRIDELLCVPAAPIRP